MPKTRKRAAPAETKTAPQPTKKASKTLNVTNASSVRSKKNKRTGVGSKTKATKRVRSCKTKPSVNKTKNKKYDGNAKGQEKEVERENLPGPSYTELDHTTQAESICARILNGNPILYRDIRTAGCAVCALATLDAQLYVLVANKPNVTVYDRVTHKVCGRVEVPGMKNGVSLAACKYHNCIYISDVGLGCIHRIQLSDRSVTKWSVGAVPAGISVYRNHNLLVCIPAHHPENTGYLQEYSTSGQLLTSNDLDYRVQNVQHAVELCTMSRHYREHLAVCQLSLKAPSVLLVDKEGFLMQPLGRGIKPPTGPARKISCLAVDSQDNIFVADSASGKISIVNNMLKKIGEVKYFSDGLTCVHLDELGRELYIGESAGRILVLAKPTTI